MRICVFGAASTKIDPTYVKTVEELGRKMAERNHGLVFGAGGNGLMGAAARGVKSKDGEIIGVIPTFFKESKVEAIYEECTNLIFTETMRERKQKMEDLSDAFIIVPGGIGTFEEFFEVLTLKQLGRHTKPIVVYNVNGYYTEMQAMMERAMQQGFVNRICERLAPYFTDPDEMLTYIEQSCENPEYYQISHLKDG